MTAFDILSLSATDLLSVAGFELRAFRARIADLPALGIRDVCGLDVTAGIARIDAELAHRAAPVATCGDVFADLCALLPA